VTLQEGMMMESLFGCRQRPSVDSDGGGGGGPPVPGGIAMERLNRRDASTDAGDEVRRPRSRDGEAQRPSICPTVHVVTDFHADRNAADTVFDAHGW